MRNNLLDVGMGVTFSSGDHTGVGNGSHTGTINSIKRVGAEMSDSDQITLGTLSPAMPTSTVVRTSAQITQVNSGLNKPGHFTIGPKLAPTDTV